MADDPFAPRRLGPVPVAGALGCVVTHGFTGSPWDMLPVAEALAREGFPVRVPLLRGHDGGWRGIAQARASTWRAGVQAEARALFEATGRPVLLVGLSMGAVLSLELAARGVVPIGGLAIIAAPMHLSVPALVLGDLARMAPPVLGERLFWPKIGGPDIQNKLPLPGAHRLPLRGLAELAELVDAARASLHRITAPTLIFHSTADHTAPPEGALLMARELGSRWIRLVMPEEGFHVLTRDVGSGQVVREVVGLASRLRETAPTNAP